MRLLYALLAERVRTNASGQFVIDGTIEVMRASVDPPYRTPSFYLAGVVVAEPPVEPIHNFEVVVIGPMGEMGRGNPIPNFVLWPIAGDPANLHIAHFGFLQHAPTFPDVGVYEFEIHLDGQKIGSVPLVIVRERAGRETREPPPTTQGMSIADVPEDQSVAAVLYQTRERLRWARLAEDGLRDPDPQRAVAEFGNVVMWGRAVTSSLVRLRNRAKGFDEWYAPWVAEMKADPFLKWMYNQRTAILKKGEPVPVASAIDVRKALQQGMQLPPPPPGAIGVFLGDPTGGVGWLVQMPDGSVGKIYARVPETASANTLELVGLPERHLGAPITERSAEHVARLYLHYLERLVATAEREFGGEHDPAKAPSANLRKSPAT